MATIIEINGSLVQDGDLLESPSIKVQLDSLDPTLINMSETVSAGVPGHPHYFITGDPIRFFYTITNDDVFPISDLTFTDTFTARILLNDPQVSDLVGGEIVGTTDYTDNVLTLNFKITAAICTFTISGTIVAPPVV